jgi:hypothetical protein
MRWENKKKIGKTFKKRKQRVTAMVVRALLIPYDVKFHVEV